MPSKKSAKPKRVVRLGVVELHTDEALREQFFDVVDNLRDAGAIVDLWLLNIASALLDHGYIVTVTTDRPAPARSTYAER